MSIPSARRPIIIHQITSHGALAYILGLAGWIVCLAWIDRAARLRAYLRRHPPLADQPIAAVDPATPVCVIVAARDEGAAIEACLAALLAQDWPALHVIAVDDRSGDATGAIMERLAARSPRLTVLHLHDLPAGWLGKNHANAQGAALPAAQGAEFLLFTDGDVLFAPDSVRRGVAVAQAQGLDHLCLTPDVITHGWLERAMCHFFGFCYLLKCKPWRIPDPRALNAYSGVGAFNLVRRTAYAAAGGHGRLRLEVLDDYKLGKLIKAGGGRCLLLDGRRQIRVRWQEGLWGVVRGLEKNAFAGCDFRLLNLGLTITMILGVFIVPMVLAVGLPGGARWGWMAAVIAQVGTLAWLGRSWADALVSPFCALVMIWALVRSAFLTLQRGGIRWRGTFYSLAALREGQV